MLSIKPYTSRLLILCTLMFCVIGVHAQDKKLLWGDTHLHSNNSFDAFINGNQTVDANQAYLYAKGIPVIHPLHRAKLQLDVPLDFMVVADHAEYYGVMREIYFNGLQMDDGFISKIKSWFYRRYFINLIQGGVEEFIKFLPNAESPVTAAKTLSTLESDIPNSDFLSRKAWLQATEIADAHNQPGVFTTFIGWEWSSVPGGGNIHRVVFTDGDFSTAKKFNPFSTFDSPYPYDLWQWMSKTSATTGADFIAIPHNSNISKGFMFADYDLKKQPLTPLYAKLRHQWEPIVEITQYKGDSETHPLLSPNDEFADFEQYTYYIQQQSEIYKPQSGDFIRSALKTGLRLKQSLGINPFEFGVIGSTDSHSGLSNADERTFTGKFALDSIPENKFFRKKNSDVKTAGVSSGWDMSASGLVAVWAEHNTRDSIMQAFRSKEVYATTGPRIQLRFFAGWDFRPSDINNTNTTTIGYQKGVPMGGILPHPTGKQTPSLMIWTQKDPQGANLDRIQVIKGWVDKGSGKTYEKIFNVSWSGDRTLSTNGTLSKVGNSVNLDSGRVKNSIGTHTLSTLWKDPEFNANDTAFYYVRVLQIPTARHGLYDALALGKKTPPRGEKVIQERAYSSPIWYYPAP